MRSRSFARLSGERPHSVDLFCIDSSNGFRLIIPVRAVPALVETSRGRCYRTGSKRFSVCGGRLTDLLKYLFFRLFGVCVHKVWVPMRFLDAGCTRPVISPIASASSFSTTLATRQLPCIILRLIDPLVGPTVNQGILRVGNGEFGDCSQLGLFSRSCLVCAIWSA